MKFSNLIRAAARALPVALVLFVPGLAMAQTVTQWPGVVKSRGNYDFGNGPLKIRMVQGQSSFYTSQGAGTGGTGGTSSTALTLTATPATPPCVGCVISGTGITAGTTVAAYNGTTGVTLSAAMTVANGTALAWGAACPTTGTNAPGQVQVQAGTGQPDVIIYSYARVCASGHLGQDGIVSVFPTSIF